MEYKLSILPEKIQKLLYIGSLYSINHLGSECKDANAIIQEYNKLLLNLGIIGRIELCENFNINPAQKLQPETKAYLKINKIKQYISPFYANKSIYILDDTDEVIKLANKNKINGIQITIDNPLEKVLQEIIDKKLHISMLFIDFDKTLSKSNFRKRWLEKNNTEIINDHFGGIERLTKIKNCIKTLETYDVFIGIISGQTSELITEVLQRIGYI